MDKNGLWNRKTTYRRISVFLCVILFMQSLCFEVLADVVSLNDEGTLGIQSPNELSLQTDPAPWEGSGTAADPYKISTPEDLKALADRVEDGNDYANTYFQLQSDIDLADMPVNYVVIGCLAYLRDTHQERPFNGTFDGNNHFIKNMKINGGDDTDNRFGLFGYIDELGTVKNLAVSGEVQAREAGGIAGTNGGTIENCVNYADVIVHELGAGPTGGGIASYCIGDNSVIRNCINYGKITTLDDDVEDLVLYMRYTGGICGLSMQGAVIEECYNAGSVEYIKNTEEVIDIYGTGSLVGVNVAGTISNSYNASDEDWYLVGLTVGFIENCYNYSPKGEISNINGIDTILDQGIVNSIKNSTHMTEDGIKEISKPTNSYVLYADGYKEDGHVECLTKSEFTDKNNFNGWDFSNIWLMSEPHKRPILRKSIEGQVREVTISGTAKYGEKLSADTGSEILAGDVQYTWYRDGEAISGASDSTYTLQAADIGKKIKVKVTQTILENKTILESAETEKVVKGDRSAPTDVTAKKASSSTATDGVIAGTSEEMEYRLDSDTSYTKASAGSTLVRPGTYMVRYAATDTYNASADVTVTIGVKLDQDAPELTTVSQASSMRMKDGWIGDVDDSMEYSIDGGETYEAVPKGKTKIEGLAYGTVYVRKKGDDDHNAGKPATMYVDYIPDIPALAEKTGTTLTVSKNDGYEYSIDGGKSWQSSATFTGLELGHTYSIIARRAATDTIPAGYISPALEVTTNKRDVKTIIKILDIEYGNGIIRAEAHIDEDVPESQILNLDVELAKEFMTDEEVARVEAGDTFILYLEIRINDDEVPEKDKKLAWDALLKETDGVEEGSAIGGYYDLSIYKKIGRSDAVKIENIDGKRIKVVMKIPDEFKAGGSDQRIFFVIRIHGITAESIASATGAEIPFETDKFSTYAIAYSDIQNRIVIVKQKKYVAGLFKKFGEDGYKYKFKVNDKTERKSIRVSRKGLAHAKRAGEATITLYRRKAEKGSAWEAVEELKFKSEKPVVQKKAGLELGKTYEASDFITEKASLQPSYYKSSDSKVVSVDFNTGRIVPLMKGSATITAVYGEEYKVAQYKTKVKIS